MGKTESNLFVDLTLSEQESLQGASWQQKALETAVQVGGSAIPAAIGSTWNWLSEDGNGFIYGDRKGSSSDLRRAGKNMPDDLPHGWNWGVLDNNEWVLGGYNGQKP